ncbi:MAG: amidase family protein, partial [Marmoricola sp.]
MTAWISRCLVEGSTDGPLAGLTFAIKDNIDLAGVPTTAADPRRSAPATESAVVVDRLLAAGASAVGKTNMDQYATGLVGTRSPYGACASVFSPDHVSGGSSSGSAVVVARGEVDFALGTDTAGSGRLPAAFNGLVGIKPSKGLVSTTGVVPACRTLDCVTVMARDIGTARLAYEQMVSFDVADPFSRDVPQRPVSPGRPRVGIPASALDLAADYEGPWRESIALMEKVADLVPIDIAPFLEAAALLYSGPWLAERWLAFGAALTDSAAVDPVVRAVVEAGAEVQGWEV